MSIRHRILWLAALALCSLPTLASDVPLDAAGNSLLSKIGGHSIWSAAKLASPQDLLLLLDDTAEAAELRKKVQAFYKLTQGLPPSSPDVMLPEREEKQLIDARNARLDALRAAVFPNGQNGSTRVLSDLGGGSVVSIRVLDADSLLQLLRDPRVKSISRVPRVGTPGRPDPIQPARPSEDDTP